MGLFNRLKRSRPETESAQSERHRQGETKEELTEMQRRLQLLQYELEVVKRQNR